MINGNIKAKTGNNLNGPNLVQKFPIKKTLEALNTFYIPLNMLSEPVPFMAIYNYSEQDINCFVHSNFL